ncbi:MAG: S1/P1 nuclease, partial [Muribaculaceae bacterium]|nr:S1/P1 nuclease [Muribaculaceae bacterium]
MKKYILLPLVAFATALSAFGWSQKGHDTVAYIAEKHLTEAAADSVSAILDGMSPVYWSNWLDNASHTPEYAYTKTWHYKNINQGVTYEQTASHPEGDVVTASRAQIAVLADSTASKADKALALKILIHLLGDMHQPMHLGRGTDRGGNQVRLQFFGRDANLHSIWDGSIMNSGHAWSYSEWQQQLDRLSPEAQAEVAAGNIDDWAKETHLIATDVYDSFPAGTKVSYDQVAEWTP